MPHLPPSTRRTAVSLMLLAALGVATPLAAQPDPVPNPNPNQPTLIDMQVEAMPEIDPKGPVVDFLEVKATRTEANAKPNYSIELRGTLHRPDGLDQAYGPMAWSVTHALDAKGQPMRYTTEGYVSPDALLNEAVGDLYRRLGPTMSRLSAQRMPFALRLNRLDYLTPVFQRLSIRSYVILADDPQELDLELPDLGESADVAGAWVLTVEQLGDRQELLLHAVDAEPSVWPLRLELIDEQGNVISTGYRRGIQTLDSTMATQWRFSQPTLVPSPAESSDESAQPSDANAEAPGVPEASHWRLRLQHTTGLRLQQLDTVLGNVTLIDLDPPAPAEPAPSSNESP